MGQSTHGKKTVITVGGVTLTGCDTSELTRGHDEHERTEYGADDHGATAGLGKHKFTLGGWYDVTVSTGNTAVLRPLADSGATAVWTRKPEGTGTGKPLETFNGFVASYVTTSPVADIVRWKADISIDGGIASSTLP